LSESLQEWTLHLPNVTKTIHRFGGTEFQVHGLEFMILMGLCNLTSDFPNKTKSECWKRVRLNRIASFIMKPVGSRSKSVRKRILRTRKN